MMERNRATRNRDVALTMLIDLLVQVIFVFTLILISANAIEGDPQERGWITPEAWKTLISIFDIDPRNVRGAEAQLGVIKGKYEKLNTELVACDAKTGACDKQAGRGPGNSPCRNSAGVEMVVAEATIDQRGRITVALGRHARDLPDRQAVSARAIGVPLSVEEFGSSFRSWREQGLARHPPCAFKVDVRYDPRAPAGNYEPARRAIASLFTLSAPPQQF
ncbi:MAG TPA: hypothetical protein VE964_01195 [Myxococcales bacterium]|nr:hypothetical protein [Myxococcales bacterium]